MAAPSLGRGMSQDQFPQGTGTPGARGAELPSFPRMTGWKGSLHMLVPRDASLAVEGLG